MLRTSMIALCLAAQALAPGQASAAPPTQPPLPVGHCLNTGNHLEADTENGWGGKRLEAQDFARMRAAGFDTVRIPVNWHTHSAAAAPHTIDPAWLARVDVVVSEALAAHLNVILNSHNFLPVHADPATGAPWLAAVWQQVAAHFADRTTAHLWFEIENEPHDRLNNANLLPTLLPALAAIRATNPGRPVVIGGEFWSGIDSLATLSLPDDPQVYPTFHYYEPFAFTHQGAAWIHPAPPPLGRRYGLDEDKARLVTDLAKVRAYVARTGRTPFIGETGAYTTADPADRIAYARGVTQGFAPAKLGVCVWAYTNTFPVWDQHEQRWLPGMLEALGLPDSGKP